MAKKDFVGLLKDPYYWANTIGQRLIAGAAEEDYRLRYIVMDDHHGLRIIAYASALPETDAYRVRQTTTDDRVMLYNMATQRCAKFTIETGRRIGTMTMGVSGSASIRMTIWVNDNDE